MQLDILVHGPHAMYVVVRFLVNIDKGCKWRCLVKCIVIKTLKIVGQSS